MNYQWDQLYRMAVLRHREDIAAAEQYRLVEDAAQNDREQTVVTQSTRRPQRMLFSLGVHLSNWGCRLQSRYGQLQ